MKLNEKGGEMMNIELKKWSLDDKEGLMNIMNHIDRTYLSNRLPFPYTEDHALYWFKMVQEHEGKDGVYRAICVDGHIVGNISIEKMSDIYSKDSEIGYSLLPEFKSKGIMSEAVKLICHIAFEELDIHRITGLVFRSHIASLKVLENNQFVLEGIKKQAVYKHNQIYDLCIYGRMKNNHV